MNIIRREDFFEAQRLLRVYNLPEMAILHAGSLWVECVLTEVQRLCLVNNGIAVATA